MRYGWVGLSGGANGPDDSLTKAIDVVSVESMRPGRHFGEIYLPSPSFNHLNSGDLEGACIFTEHPYASTIARIARCGYYGLDDYGIKLHSRNAHQVLGFDLLSPVDIVLISAPYTKGGKVIGGTGTAVAIAKAFDIVVINLQMPNGAHELEVFLKLIKTLPSGSEGKFKRVPEADGYLIFEPNK